MVAYLPRVVDALLAARLASAGAVLIEGPKACGKTFTAEQQAASRLYLDTDDGARVALGVDPSLVLSGDRPQLIDEWQLDATRVWNHVRAEVDRRQGSGLYILTGSATPPVDSRRHSGAGRFARLTMRPMSLYESGDSTGEMSLTALLDGHRPTARSTDATVSRFAELVVRGGWPLNLTRTIAAAAQANVDYLTTIADVDLPTIDPARRHPRLALRVLQSLARNTGMEYVVSRVARDASTDDSDIARSTVYDYLAPLERLMLLDPLGAWSSHLRSRARLRTSPRVQFCDPSLAVAALRAAPGQLLADMQFFGHLFEALVVRDLRVYASVVDGTVQHYRDSDGLEIDAVVTAGDGRWAALEVKVGSGEIDRAAENLLAFARKADTSRIGDPAALAVVTATGFGYTRPDGVVVIPLAALGP
ncbi:MAG: ATP-binding protein [Ilumatobacteraceae bacterium]